MIFEYELESNSLKVMMPKEIDHHNTIDLRKQTDMMVDSYQVKTLTLDFRNTEFMDSSGIGMMIGRCKNMEYHKGEVKVVNMSRRIRKIFLLSGLYKMIEMEDVTDETE